MFLFDTGLTVSGYVNVTVAVISWALMVPVTLGALFWHRIGSWVPRVATWMKGVLGLVGFPLLFG
jgi:hypothetical protein